MPVVRYQIRNEYGLADPELYGAADKDDPEALLEGVAMAGLVGVLRQLGDLAEFAAQIFHDLHEEVMATSARGHSLTLRVQQLEVEFPAIEKDVLSQTTLSHLTYNRGIEWHPNIQMGQGVITQGDMPRFILNSYEDCSGPPQLFTLDKFDVSGAGACLKRYSDPSFFKMDFASSGKMESEIPRDKKAHKTKKKRFHVRNGDTLGSLLTPDGNSKSQLLVSEKVPNNVSMKRVKLKMRPVNSLSTTVGRSYMECVLNREPSDQNVLCENTFDRSHINRKSIGRDSEAHDIMIDASSNSSLSTERQQARPTIKQRLTDEGTDRLGELKVKDNITESLWIPTDETAVGKKFSKDYTETAVNGNSNGNDGEELEENNFNKLKQKELGEAGSKSDGSGDFYVSDDVASELDQYVDALTTMDSEMETDTESRFKQEQGLPNMDPQRMDSGTCEKQHETEIQHSTENSNGLLDCNYVHHEKSCLKGEEFFGSPTDVSFSQGNEAHSSFENLENYSPLYVPANVERYETMGQDINSTKLHESTMVMGLDSLESHENTNDYRVCSVKPPEVCSYIFEIAQESCNSPITSLTSSPNHLDAQAGCEDVQTPDLYLKDVNTEISAEPHGNLNSLEITNVDLNMISPNLVGSNQNTTKNMNGDLLFTENAFPTRSGDTGLAIPAENSNILYDAPPMQPYDMEGMDHKISCDFIYEKEVSAECVKDDSPEVSQTVVFEGYVLENVSNGYARDSPASLVEEEPNMLIKHCPENEDEVKGIPLNEDFEGSRPERHHESNVDGPESEPHILRVQKLDSEHFPNKEKHVLNYTELKLQALASEDVEPRCLEVHSDILDGKTGDESVHAGDHPNWTTTLASEILENTLLVEQNTISSGSITESGYMEDCSNRHDSVPNSFRKASGPEYKMQEVCALHESILDQHNLKGGESLENISLVDSQQSSELLCPVSPDEEHSVIVLSHPGDDTPEHHNIDSSDLAPPLMLNHDPQIELLDHAEVSSRHAEENEINMPPPDAVQASDQCYLEIVNSATPSPECLKEMQRPGIGHHQQEGIKVADSPDPWFDITVQAEVKGITQQVLSSLDLSDLGNCIYHADPSEQDHEVVDPSDYDKARLFSLVNDQDLDSEAHPSNTSEDSTGSSPFSGTMASRVQSFDCFLSNTPVELGHSLEYLNTSNIVVELLDEPLMTETHVNISCSETSALYPSSSKAHDCNLSEVEACIPVHSSSEHFPMSMENIDNLDMELQNAAACDILVARKKTSGLDISPQNSLSGDHLAEDYVPVQSSSELSLRSLENNSDMSFPSSSSFGLPIPEIISFRTSEPGRLDHVSTFDASQCYIDEAPPLPPLPPMEWRLGKLRVGPKLAEVNVGLKSWTPQQLSDQQHESLGEKTHQNIPLRNIPALEEVRSEFGCLNLEEDRKDIFASDQSTKDERRHYEINSSKVETANSSQSASVAFLEDEKYPSGQHALHPAILPPLTQSVLVPMSCNGNTQHFFCDTEEQMKPLKRCIPFPIVERDLPQSEDPNAWRELHQPSSPVVLAATTQNDYYQDDGRSFGGERMQHINLLMSSSTTQIVMPRDDLFTPGGENTCADISIMDSEKPNSRHRSIRNRPRDPLIQAVASHDKSTLRKVSEMTQRSAKLKVDERDTLLEQIRNKSFSLKPAVATKPSVNGPATNIKLVAILEKANAIRQAFVGSDEDDDNWSDC